MLPISALIGWYQSFWLNADQGAHSWLVTVLFRASWSAVYLNILYWLVITYMLLSDWVPAWILRCDWVVIPTGSAHTDLRFAPISFGYFIQPMTRGRLFNSRASWIYQASWHTTSSSIPTFQQTNLLRLRSSAEDIVFTVYLYCVLITLFLEVKFLLC